MTHLSDMEEILQKIQNVAIADYMREALKCYGAGAYRGCIVLSSIALFDDSFNKLAEIRSVNKKAREIHDEVAKRQASQDVYESYLLDQLTSNKLISALDASTAEVIKNRRNKSAHASGHTPSAEEARFVFFEVIDKFLSKPAFSSKVLADEILSRLANSGFFPSNITNDVQSVVEHEIKLLHKDAYPYLISKLIDDINSSSRYSSQNSRYFLDGLACLNDKSWNNLILNKLLEKKLDDENYRSQCLASISINPNFMGQLTAISLERLKLAISHNISNTPNSSSVNSPAQFFENILNKETDVLELLNIQCEEFLNKHSYLSTSPKLAISNSDLWSKYQEILLDKAGSSSFDTANNFTNNFQSIEEQVVSNSDGAYILKVVLAVTKAAEWGAWRAESVVSEKFKKFGKLKNSTCEYLKGSPSESILIIKEKFPAEKTSLSFMSKYLELEVENV
jgi:hypothetical protein